LPGQADEESGSQGKYRLNESRTRKPESLARRFLRPGIQIANTGDYNRTDRSKPDTLEQPQDQYEPEIGRKGDHRAPSAKRK
jgi:hypothetical protein